MIVDIFLTCRYWY